MTERNKRVKVVHDDTLARGSFILSHLKDWFWRKRTRKSNEDPPTAAMVGARPPKPTPPPLEGSVALYEPFSPEK